MLLLGTPLARADGPPNYVMPVEMSEFRAMLVAYPEFVKWIAEQRAPVGDPDKYHLAVLREDATIRVDFGHPHTKGGLAVVVSTKDYSIVSVGQAR